MTPTVGKILNQRNLITIYFGNVVAISDFTVCSGGYSQYENEWFVSHMYKALWII